MSQTNTHNNKNKAKTKQTIGFNNILILYLPCLMQSSIIRVNESSFLTFLSFESFLFTKSHFCSQFGIFTISPNFVANTSNAYVLPESTKNGHEINSLESLISFKITNEYYNCPNENKTTKKNSVAEKETRIKHNKSSKP